jgi:hypothetical protein
MSSPPLISEQVLTQTVIGLVAGLALGLSGYFGGREYDSDRGLWEQFQYAKIGRTLVIYGAAGALVGYMGEPITQGNIVASTGSTVVLGEIAERLIKGFMKQHSAPSST